MLGDAHGVRDITDLEELVFFMTFSYIIIDLAILHHIVSW